ncbi:MAG: hypothetical protein GX230_06570 [Lentisphaerae bacterium]|jgi:hypothetical protein|nr:hypothetical protein [Lentisphaerota bacterium]
MEPYRTQDVSFISRNWAAQPLESYDTILNLVRSTTTKSGLRICVRLGTKNYDKGIEVSDKQMKQTNLAPHTDRQNWNYMIAPT